jgi:ribosomal-protein-alanine N-acetyltransferase
MGVGADSVVNRRNPMGTAAMIFSPMRHEDLDAVMEIERSSFVEPWTPGLFLHELRVPFSKTIVARAGAGTSAVLGYICRWLVGDEVHILNLAVHPECRHRGLGRALVQHILREAEARQATLVTLEVRRHNVAALALYRSLGFAERGVRRNYYGHGQDAIIMGRTRAAGNEAPVALPVADERGDDAP